YKKEIFEYRWHIFFSSYLESLIHQSNYRKVLKVVRQNRLLELEKKYQDRANYLPTLLWYNAVAEYKEMMIGEEELYGRMEGFMQTLVVHADKYSQAYELLLQLKQHIPRVVNRLLEKFPSTGELMPTFL
ncbi:MAG: hypothetical protein KDC43_17210, partial [Saprospiraceae bacterium]|nr:hypothetical protein [Saprospiraceae bacterium]